MINHYITEDKKLLKLLVIFSPKIRKRIDAIDDYNQTNIESLAKMYEYIARLKSYKAYPVITWDNTNRYRHNLKG